MTDETKIRVRLDTTQAKSEMDQLERRGEKASKSLSQKIRSKVWGATGGFAIGAAAGGTVAALRGATGSGVGDLVGDTFAPFGAQLNELIFGKLDDEARAAKAAREELIAAFGTQTGIEGSVPGGASAFFDQMKALRLQEERGRSLIEQDTRFGGGEVASLIERLPKLVGEEVGAALAPIRDLLSTLGLR